MEKELTQKEKNEQVLEEARKVMTAGDKLVTLANTLDEKGLTREASVIDEFLKDYFGPCKGC